MSRFQPLQRSALQKACALSLAAALTAADLSGFSSADELAVGFVVNIRDRLEGGYLTRTSSAHPDPQEIRSGDILFLNDELRAVSLFAVVQICGVPWELDARQSMVATRLSQRCPGPNERADDWQGGAVGEVPPGEGLNFQ